MNSLCVENQHLKYEAENLKIIICTQKDTITDLELSCKTENEVAQKLHKKINESIVQVNKKKEFIKKECKAEVKAWRKDLGDEVTKNKKLGEQLKIALENTLD